MSKRIIAVLAVALGLLAPSMGHSAVVAPQITDKQGDANGVNSQGNGYFQSAFFQTNHLSPDSMTPALGAQGPDSLDILSVRFSTEKVATKPTNLLVAVSVNGAPASGDLYHRYVVTFKLGDCAAVHDLRWDVANTALTPTGLYAPGATFNRGKCKDDAKSGIALPKSTIAGKTLTFRIPLTEVGKVGNVLNTFTASSFEQIICCGSGYTPVMFDLASSTRTYVIGQ